jgi:hypothetical protein
MRGVARRLKILRRHARLYAGHPRLYFFNAVKQDVYGRDKPGHDVEG